MLFVDGLLLHEIQSFKAIYEVSEHSELAVESLVLPVRHEELARVLVRALVRHRQSAPLVMLQSRLNFIFERLSVDAIAALARVGRISALHDESFDISVKLGPIVVATGRKG